MRQDKRKRHEKQSLPRRRDHTRPQRHRDVLEQHIAHDHEARHREGDALEPQRFRADTDDLRVVAPEHRNDLRREEKTEHRKRQQDKRGRLDAETEAARNALVLACAVVEAADRLKSLTEADHRRACELANAGDDAHRRDSRIAVGPRRRIEAGHGNRGQSLAAQARNAAAREVGVACRRGRKQAQPDADTA